MHRVTLTTHELVFTIGALIDTHRRYTKLHQNHPDTEYSPYPLSINVMVDAYNTLNAAMAVPRKEVLEKV